MMKIFPLKKVSASVYQKPSPGLNISYGVDQMVNSEIQLTTVIKAIFFEIKKGKISKIQYRHKKISHNKLRCAFFIRSYLFKLPKII